MSNVDKPLEGRSSKRWLQHTPSEKKEKKTALQSIKVLCLATWCSSFYIRGVKQSSVATYSTLFCNKSTQRRKRHPRRKVCALVVSSHLCVCDEFGLKACESSCLLSLMPFRADIYVAVFKKKAGRKKMEARH